MRAAHARRRRRSAAAPGGPLRAAAAALAPLGLARAAWAAAASVAAAGCGWLAPRSEGPRGGLRPPPGGRRLSGPLGGLRPGAGDAAAAGAGCPRGRLACAQARGGRGGAAAPTAPIEPLVEDVRKLTVPKLRARLQEFGLDTKGRKAELVQRCEDYLREQPGSLNDFTVPQLKEQLRALGLRVSGRKGDLIRRLQDAQDAPPEGGGRTAGGPAGSGAAAPPAAWDVPPRIVLGDVELGQRYLGTVLRTSEQGVLVDVGEEQPGLVSASWLDSSAVPGLSEALRPGEVVDAWVIAFTPEGDRRLAVALRRPLPDTSEFVDVPRDEWLRGVVRCAMAFGFFVEVSPPEGGSPQWGLLPMGQVGEGGPSRIGDTVRVRVADVDASAGRLGLSMRPLPPVEEADDEGGADAEPPDE